jgi:hypothetical protein
MAGWDVRFTVMAKFQVVKWIYGFSNNEPFLTAVCVPFHKARHPPVNTASIPSGF